MFILRVREVNGLPNRLPLLFLRCHGVPKTNHERHFKAEHFVVMVNQLGVDKAYAILPCLKLAQIYCAWS